MNDTSTVTDEDNSFGFSFSIFHWSIATDVPIYVWIGYFIGTLTTVMSCFLAAYTVINHLRNYTKPNLQKYIVRIIYMAPIYSVCSSLSLAYWHYAKFFDLGRDCYEAYILYSFFSLLLGYINEYENTHPEEQEAWEKDVAAKRERLERGELDEYDSDVEDEETPLVTVVDGHKVYFGEERVVYVLKTKGKISIGAGCYPIPTPCVDCIKLGLGRTFLRWVKRGIIQFVFMKPTLAIASLLLDRYGSFEEGELSFANGYLYIVIFENLSVSIAVYVLIMFYHALEHELKPFRPIAKFLCIKAIILFAMWQAIGVAVANYYHLFEYIPGVEAEQASVTIQDLLVSVEMCGISFAMMWVFGWDPYVQGEKGGVKDVVKNLIHTVNQVDVLKDTVKTFSFDDQKAKALEKAIKLEQQQQVNPSSPLSSERDDRYYESDDYSSSENDDMEDRRRTTYQNPPSSSRYGTY